VIKLILPFFLFFFILSAKVNELNLLKSKERSVELASVVFVNPSDSSSKLDPFIEQKTPLVIGLSGFSENLHPQTEGPHYGHFYGRFGQALEEKLGYTLVFFSLPEHNPFQDHPSFVQNSKFDLKEWFSSLVSELISKGAVIKGFYGNSTGGSLVLDAFARHNKILTKQENFQIFLSSPAINVHFSKGQKLLAFLLKFNFFKKLIQFFKKSFHVAPNAENFKRDYPLVQLSNISPFSEFSWDFMASFLRVVRNPKALDLAYSQNLTKVPMSIAYNPNDKVVDAFAVQEFIDHLKRKGWQIFSKPFDGPGHSLPLTDQWNNAIEFFLNPS
jgi:hypothetical protein